MGTGIDLRYIRRRLVSALAIVACVTIGSYALNRILYQKLQDQEELSAAIDDALSIMMEQFLFFGGIRDATGPYLAADDFSQLSLSLPGLERAIAVMEADLADGTMLPQVRAVFENPLLDPLSLLRNVATSGRGVVSSERWGDAAAYDVGVAIGATRQVLPLMRRIKELGEADLARASARADLWQRGSIVLTLFLLVLIWTGIFRPLQRQVIEDREALREGRRNAEIASAAKSTFIATMSHEIRTPLVGVLGAAELMKEETEPAARLELADTVLSSGRALLTILDDILNFTRIESGAVTIVPAPLSIVELVGDIHRLFAPRAAQKGLAFRMVVSPELAARHMGDSMRLRQILSNLVGNALKFTETGSVVICAHADAATTEGQGVVVEIRDTGLGMTQEELGRVFDSFTQANNSIVRTHGGTGLGLSISRQLARAMGGDIAVESRSGVGSTFRLTIDLPVIADHGGVPAADAPPAVGGYGRPAPNVTDLRPAMSQVPNAPSTAMSDGPAPVVLIVDDNSTNRLIATRMLDGTGWEIAIACNGHQAVEAAQEKDPALILMDISMPGMDGYAATRAIRDAERRSGRAAVRIVAMSAHADGEHRTRCDDAGMDGVIAKPFSRGEIVGLLARPDALGNPARAAGK
ncbi:signal transduction histidine kinase [Palleronia aestuarii]|uniref:histidine kinase n=1 Tax=Palleronia aestuarii TaxID=568105 RepID=A0A2W7MSR6_9RHOB|nr:ATP-binding protein [Palleronia aestuarii]PZX10593.1 signal transduction histidine kinase [Palleronia aestuarii]